MTNITTIDLLRHGEPVGGRRYRGQIDDPLSDKGWRQMREAVAGHSPWDVVVSSPLSRCRAFAEELAGQHDMPLSFDERLMEIGFGDWEGRTADDITADNPEALKRFYRDPVTHRPQGAEKLADFHQRITAAVNAVLEQHAGKHVLVVGHAGMMRMIMSQALEIPVENMFRLYVPNAAVTRIEYSHDDNHCLPRLLFHAGSLG